MPVVRPQTAARATRAIKSVQMPTTRQLSVSAPRAADHGPQYDPPSGWLFGVKPGEKYQKEGWETPYFYGFIGSLAVFTVAYAFKPDTS